MKLIAGSGQSAPTENPTVLQLQPDVDAPAAWAAAGAGVEVIELTFPKFTDGRAFSQAVLLVPGAPSLTPEPSLAATGSSPAPLIAAGLMLVAGGLALAVTRRVRAGR